MRSLSEELSNVCKMVRAPAWWGHPQLFGSWQTSRLALQQWERDPAEAQRLSQMILYWRATLLGHPAATGRKKQQKEPYPL
jgi:hypothetical protein